MNVVSRSLLFLLATCALAAPGLRAKPAPPPDPAPVPSGPLYFFNLDHDARDQFVGRGPLTPEAAATQLRGYL